MSLNKTLRFQILRRDGFACHYCGATAQDTALHIDHVLPVALGGQDNPENLITSCMDCNHGKGSTPPDAALLDGVKQDATRWADAIAQAALELARRHSEDDFAWFLDAWNAWTYGQDHATGNPRKFPLPAGWRNNIRTWLHRGLTREVILSMVEVAMAKDRIPPRDTFNYFAGCCWRSLDAIEKRAEEICQQEQDDGA